MHFIIKYSFGGENTVFGITEYSFWFPEVGRSAALPLYGMVHTVVESFERFAEMFTTNNKSVKLNVCSDFPLI